MAERVPLYKIPTVLETAGIVGDDFLDEYREAVMQKYNSPKAREILLNFNTKNGELTGSSPFMNAFLANSGLLPQNSRLATRTDIEAARANVPEFLRGRYSDIGLALRTNGDSNEANNFLAKNLAEQLKSRGIALPALIYFLDLASPKEDENSPYGLSFALNEQANKDSVHNLKDFKWRLTRDDGLSRAFFFNVDWDSSSQYLAYSYSIGRVVSVSAEGAPQNFLEDRLSELQKDRDEQIREIQERYAKAQAMLRGE